VSGARDQGMTLVELLVAMMVFAVLASLLMLTVGAANRSATSTTNFVEMSDEARSVVTILSRDLRELQQIDATYPASGDGHAGITFEDDFNNDGTIETSSSDPEILTICYSGTTLLLAAGAVNCDSSPSGSTIATGVSSFSLTYFSSYNLNGVTNESWSALDAAGDNNGILDSAEWSKIDSIGIAATVSSGTHSASYSTTVDLPNR
jgi:prepilin-type N-terminal cleavage/methylation domain-containing protein